MNPVLLAASGALADTVPEKGATPAPNGAQRAGTFSLSPTATGEAAERLRGAKINQQRAHNGEREQVNDPAAMQVLMALLLTPPTQPAEQMPLPGGEIVKMLAAGQTQAGVATAGLRQLADALTQKGSDGQQNPRDLASLLPTLQEVLATLSQQTPQAGATPEQQAALATFSAQNLRAIAPGQPSTSQQFAARAKQTDGSVAPRPLAMKKNDDVTLHAPAAQNLLNVAVQNPQPLNATVSHSITVAHVSLPTAISGDELGEKLTALLKDRIQFQIGQQQQISTIRLDPPSLGKLEIAVQLDAGKLMVHIGASQSDVCRSLQQFSNDLRQHLTAQNFMEVNVQVSSEGQSQQQQQPGHQQEEVLSALSLSDEPQFQQNESVLIKV
ncbi:flagellar hook-length control protein FliK [Citrobacter rodentium]|uniref:Lateral flagellar hook length control protein n=2 Tax=Citrobacter rodentium TaxID=67825 RepID=D2TJ99_CITRI|nr:flagellar hook-length control protein FliK [Citrobacter rodentium]KIQ51180.1 flagellar hook-length control protein FliK [Citrobacter rodentium]QBY31558.1 flagellar hook-length control protein FliK [Citrobacter rodentium]UHO31085.1 flagellar hook-length control protein FliK [Citrobacter rodentium NBRC 105723 = DSM 16636]CBG87107.1 lateral flagellar hook length control protein [Citrobacter rodentium ICC168]HAT8014139.1 flagellar hook-length control protein FliK [Citrobacter rodentium NBRC 105